MDSLEESAFFSLPKSFLTPGNWTTVGQTSTVDPRVAECVMWGAERNIALSSEEIKLVLAWSTKTNRPISEELDHLYMHLVRVRTIGS